MMTIEDNINRKCARCSWPGDVMDLAGGYIAILCIHCENQFTADADASQQWTELRISAAERTAVRDLLKAGKDMRPDYIAACERLARARTAMRKFAEAWMKRPRTPQELDRAEATLVR